MNFLVGYDFKRSYKDLTEFRKEVILDLNISDTSIEEDIIKENPTHLIAWVENLQVLGWAIWHKTNMKEHRRGDPRDKSDIVILEKLLGGRKNAIELHEIWLKKEYRGKGYGNQFFNFFEDFVSKLGYDSIIYYANNPSAIAICRKRGYEEIFNKQIKEYTFCKKFIN